jgi:ZIP family zinc transporter
LEGSAPLRLNSAWLIILAIAIHNFPEGLSVGVTLGRGYNVLGAAVAIAMGLHNIPEGLACALPLASEGYSARKVLWYTTLTGLVTPIGAVIGASAVELIEAILPYGLAFAAGAMLYIVFDEMIPQSHRNGHEFEATLGGLGGFALMIIINSLLL